MTSKFLEFAPSPRELQEFIFVSFLLLQFSLRMHGKLHQLSATAGMGNFGHLSRISNHFKQWLKVYVVPYFSRIAQPFKEWFRACVTPYLPGGWRTAALVNTILMAIVSVLMITLSAAALARAGGFNRALVLFAGACGVNGASTLNVTLHIIINIISTLFLLHPTCLCKY